MDAFAIDKEQDGRRRIARPIYGFLSSIHPSVPTMKSLSSHHEGDRPG
jgi:hypothetical protein